MNTVKVMHKEVRNTDIYTGVWMRCFTRKELRDIARTNKIRQGSDKHNTATNLRYGVPVEIGGTPILFNMTLSVTIKSLIINKKSDTLIHGSEEMV